MTARDPVVHSGEIWLADLDKARPVIFLTRDPLGRLLHSVIIAPVTSTIQGLSTEVPVGLDDGIRHPSVANLDFGGDVDLHRADSDEPVNAHAQVGIDARLELLKAAPADGE